MPAMSKRRIWAGGAGAIGIVAGVATLVGVSPTTGPTTPAAAATELTPFDTCDQLRSWYVKAALPHVTAWGWDAGAGPVPPGFVDMPAMSSAGREATGQDDIDAVGNGATGTNVQEAGVDEPDLAKTDGELVALVRRGDLLMFDATADEPHEIGRVGLPDRLHVTELLLVGDRAVLFGSSAGLVPYEMPVLDRGFVPYGGSLRTTVTTVDLADPTAPTVVRTEVVDGELVSAREHDGLVRIATTWTPDFDFVYPDGRLGLPEAAAKNRQIVRSAAAEEWLPGRRIDGAAEQPLLSCADVRHPRDAAGVGTISVLTMDPDDPAVGSTTGLAADGNLMYASDDRLYVATTDDGWMDWTWRPANDGDPARTDIHAFAVDAGTTTYVGSGDVPGRVPDRWAFSEHEGLLRVASTTGPAWEPRETRVTVLAEADGRLDPVGSVGGMGENEQIESFRWFGDVAVVVTFRQVDPLYTLDLGDPTRPAVVGELKIPGFSAYLHPIGDDRLLGVGQDATGQGMLRGSQLSTFDLGDLTAPTRVDTLGFGGMRISTVESDSRAFSYLPDQRLAFVPTWDWRGGSTIEVARIGDDGGLGALRSIALPRGADAARVLPLDDGRVAIVAGGDVVQVADPTAW
jgi:Beta propeller domain